MRRWEGGRHGRGTSGLSLRGQIASNAGVRFGHLHLLNVALVVVGLMWHFVKRLNCVVSLLGVGRVDLLVLIWKNVTQKPLCKGLKPDTFTGLICDGDSFRMLLSVLNF